MASPLVKGYGFGLCRLLGHLWHVVPSDWTPTFGVPMTVRCERCDIERRDSVNRQRGDIEARRYLYPAGYQFHHQDPDDQLPRRIDFRLAWLEGEITEMRKQREARSSES